MSSIYIHDVNKIKVTETNDLESSFSKHIIISDKDSKVILDVVLFSKNKQDLQFDFFTEDSKKPMFNTKF